MNLRLPFLLALGLPLVISVAAQAVLIDWGDGSGNTSQMSAPVQVQDPGWSNVGSCNGVSCVYLGDGWMLTANHVGAGDAYFESGQYPWLIGSSVRLHNPDDSDADLLMFLIYPPYPPALDLSIASITASSDSTHPLYLIGNGRNRGAATTWNPPGPGSYNGYLWGPGGAKRWGTNLVEIASSFDSAFGTHVFGTVFDESGFGHTTYEAQGANGDSGGAVLAWNGSSYQLAGITIGMKVFGGQPAETSLFLNETYAADLSIYRDEIVETMLPEPAGGLVAGVAFLAAVQVGRRSRPTRSELQVSRSEPEASEDHRVGRAKAR